MKSPARHVDEKPNDELKEALPLRHKGELDRNMHKRTAVGQAPDPPSSQNGRKDHASKRGLKSDPALHLLERGLSSRCGK